MLQTTWDRPGLGELDGQLNDSAQSNDSDENTLPPNWIGKDFFALSTAGMHYSFVLIY
jgi:hypothetical protein